MIDKETWRKGDKGKKIIHREMTQSLGSIDHRNNHSQNLIVVFI